MEKKFIIVTVCLVFCGCALFSKGNSAALKNKEPLDIVKALDRSRLKTGGNLLIVPFRAGAGVEATKELDRSSLMLVKGLAETLQKNHSPFKILTANNADTADLVIKGHVVKLEESRGMKRWLKGTQRFEMGVAGGMIDQKTGRAVLHFLCHKTAEQKNEDYKSMAYALGQDIAEYIINQLHSK